MPSSRTQSLSFFSAARSAAIFALLMLCTAFLTISAQAAPPNPVPHVDIVSPESIAPGSSGVTLTLHGTGYALGVSTVIWNGTPLVTTVVSAKLLTAIVPNALVAAQGFGTVTVANIAPGGGTSNVVYVPVTQPLLASNFPATPSSSYPLGSLPAGVATGDFNGDGKVDLAIANSGGTTDSVSILMGNGDGTFTAKPDVPVSVNPNWVVVGDFNGDGKADLAVINLESGGPSSVFLMLGNGDGTFTFKSTSPTGIASNFGAAGDFNGDGKLDLAVTNSNDSNVSILLGNGDGTFAVGTAPTVGALPIGIVVGDFNEDGILDLAVANEADNTVSMLLGVGDGTFHAQTTTLVGGSGVDYGLIAGDFNGDGHLDVAAVNIGDVAILLGNGAGVLTLNANPAGIGSPNFFTGATGDLNGDSKLDLVVADGGSGGVLFSGNGDGTFGTATGFNTGTNLWGAAIADFNGDGAPDVAFTNYNDPGSASILLQVVPVSLAPSSLSFGNQGLSFLSGGQTVTVKNNTLVTVNISSITITGTNAGDFQDTTTCGATLATTATCTITVKFLPTLVGARSAVLKVTDDADGSPQTLALSGTGVVLTQTIAKTFGAATVPVNGSTSLSFTITNPNPGISVTNVAFTDALPSGLVVSTPNGLTGTCGGGTITATAGANAVSLTGATIAASGSCTFSANVTGTTAGVQTNTVQVTSTEGGTSPVSTASVTVVTPPTIVKSFGVANVPVNTPTTLSFTITNPSASVALTGVAVTDTLPAGLVVSTPNGLTGSCGTGTITATAGSGSVVLAAGTIATSGSCTFGVNVTGTTAGTKVNTTAAVTSTNGGTGGTATATLTVTAPDLTITKTHTGNFQQGQTGAVYTIAVTNSGNASTAGTVTVVDTLPTGLTATALAGTGWTCTVGTATCTRADALLAAASYPPITLTVTVSATAAASLTNSVTVAGGGEINLANDTATSPTTITAVAADFSITASPTTATVAAGANASYTLTLTPLNGVPFGTAITFAASGLPGGAVANFTPVSVTPGSSPATDAFVITTTNGVAGNFDLRSAPIFAFGMPIAGIFLMGFGFRKKKGIAKSRAWMILLVLCTGFVFWGCANTPQGARTPAGTYTVTVTATGGTVVHTTPVTLTVSP